MFLIEIIALVFLCRKNGELAIQKGLKPGIWKFYTVIAWIIAEFLGCVLGVVVFLKGAVVTDIKQIQQSDLFGISLIALFAAFGGYLLIRYILDHKQNGNDNMRQVGIDDLQPPKK